MALDRDELNRRRKEREQQRKKQEAARRRLLFRLGIALLVLLACGVVIFLISRGVDRNAEPVMATSDATAPQERPEDTVPPTEPRSALNKGPTVIHVAAAGDLNITDKVIWSGQTGSEFNYTKAFMDVAPIFSDADLALLNFEGNLCGAPYGSQTGSAPQQLMEGLKNAGIDLVQIANSYSIYNGISGLKSTLTNIRAAGIEPVGAYSTNEEFRRNKGYTICEVNGIKIAFVAFTKGVGSLGLPAGSENCVNLLYKDYYTTYNDIDTEAITAVLKAAASEKPDLTIALLHWGSEYNETIYDSQEKIVSLLQKNGVNAIIGSHPHLVQKIDYDEVTGNLVAYSLGDFFGDAKRGGTSYSIILDLEITKDYESGTTKITDYSYTPIYTLAEDECDGSRRVVRIENAMSAHELNFVDKVTDSAYENMKFAMERIPERINPPKDKK